MGNQSAECGKWEILTVMDVTNDHSYVFANAPVELR